MNDIGKVYPMDSGSFGLANLEEMDNDVLIEIMSILKQKGLINDQVSSRLIKEASRSSGTSGRS